MEKRKLTKQDIDKVRNTEGFPIGSDEDIIALSDAPFYTACPNPFIEDFIRENGRQYDEATDDYQKEPFSSDVTSEKSDPIYNAHMYHTKVPYKAIMQYILHYTEPGDIVFDGFCGSGMTGVAAQMCECADNTTKTMLEGKESGITWGRRYAILNDLSPAATFIAHNLNTPVNILKYREEIDHILSETRKECEWMYKTRHLHISQDQQILDFGDQYGIINSVIWSEVLVCPRCGEENVFWDMAWANETEKVKTVYHCKHCNCEIIKRNCARAMDLRYDDLIGKTVQFVKFIPVSITYDYNGSRFEKNLTKKIWP